MGLEVTKLNKSGNRRLRCIGDTTQTKGQSSFSPESMSSDIMPPWCANLDSERATVFKYGTWCVTRGVFSRWKDDGVQDIAELMKQTAYVAVFRGVHWESKSPVTDAAGGSVIEVAPAVGASHVRIGGRKHDAAAPLVRVEKNRGADALAHTIQRT